MKSLLMLVCVAVFAMGLTGCVAQGSHDDLRTMYRKCQERVVELEQMLEERDAEIAMLRGTGTGGDAELAARLAQAEAEAARLRSELAALAAGPGLSPELVSALQRLADQYPGLMTFDPDRKMIKLTSDLTFGLGSTKVKPAAADSLSQLAGVLNSADAGAFEVRVVGHTDNVPVTNPANRQKFEDNWGLSAFRAKSVMEVLKKSGVSESRMSIAGYGQHQPVVANPSKGGAQANRRVEIYLVPPYNPGAAPVVSAPVAPAASSNETSADESPAMYK